MTDSPDKPSAPHDSLRITLAFQRFLRALLEKDDALSQKLRRRLLADRPRDQDE